MELVELDATEAVFDALGTVDGWIDEQVAAGVTHSEAMAILRRERERPRKRRARKAVGDEQRS